MTVENDITLCYKYVQIDFRYSVQERKTQSRTLRDGFVSLELVVARKYDLRFCICFKLSFTRRVSTVVANKVN